MASAVIGSNIYVFGGYAIHENVHKCFNGMFKLDTLKMEWTHLTTSGDAPEPRSGATMVVHDYLLYIYGGCQGKRVIFSDVFTFNPDTLEWKQIKTSEIKPIARCCHTSSVMGGKMYIFGGMIKDPKTNNIISSNELWSLNLGKFQFNETNF